MGHPTDSSSVRQYKKDKGKVERKDFFYYVCIFFMSPNFDILIHSTEDKISKILKALQ